MNIDEKTLWNYEKQKDFFQVVRRIKKTIFDQKFVGAAVGNFNANIIARDLGLAEKTENKDEVDLTLNINRNIVTGGAK